MASLGGGALLHAREGAFFKTEQEGDLHQYLKRRVKEGKIKLSEEDLKLLQGPKVITKKGLSEDVYEVDMLILQQKSRYNTLDGKSKAAMIRRVKAQMPEASPEDINRIATSMAMYGTTGLLAHQAARLPLGGGRRALKHLSRESAAQAQAAKPLSPEATEAMRRQFMVGLRTLTYGSLIGIVGVTAAVTLGASAFGIKDAQTLKSSVKSTFEPMAGYMNESTQSWKSYLKVSESKSNSIKDSDFAKTLRKRFENFKV